MRFSEPVRKLGYAPSQKDNALSRLKKKQSDSLSSRPGEYDESDVDDEWNTTEDVESDFTEESDFEDSHVYVRGYGYVERADYDRAIRFWTR